jgi:ABC-2 type transport system permease protein
VQDEREAIRLLETSEVGAVIVIPSDFDRHFYRGRGAQISIMADASDPTVASAVGLAGQGFGRDLAARMQPFATGASSAARGLVPLDRPSFGLRSELVVPEPIGIEVLPFYNPERRTAAVFVVPGLVGVILPMTMMLMTALAIVRERERGTFEFLIATPVRRTEVMLGKILPYLGVGFVQVALVLALGVLLFAVPIRGSLVDLAIGTTPFLAAMLAMGLVVSAVSPQFQAMQPRSSSSCPRCCSRASCFRSTPCPSWPSGSARCCRSRTIFGSCAGSC